MSENEILLEVRDPGKNKVHRTCKTLTNPVSVQESEVQLLIDYVVFKLKKCSKLSMGSLAWSDLGYDI